MVKFRDNIPNGLPQLPDNYSELQNKEKTVYFKPGDEAVAKFCYHPGTVIYAYCNKHGLWKKVVE